MSFVLIPNPNDILILRKIQDKFITEVNESLKNENLGPGIIFPFYPLWLELEADSFSKKTDGAKTKKTDAEKETDGNEQLPILKQLKKDISEIIIEKIEVANLGISFLCSYFLGKNKLCGKIKFAFLNRGALNGFEKNDSFFITAQEAAIKTAEKMSCNLPVKLKIFELGSATFSGNSWQTEQTVWVKKSHENVL